MTSKSASHSSVPLDTARSKPRVRDRPLLEARRVAFLSRPSLAEHDIHDCHRWPAVAGVAAPGSQIFTRSLSKPGKRRNAATSDCVADRVWREDVRRKTGRDIHHPNGRRFFVNNDARRRSLSAAGLANSIHISGRNGAIKLAARHYGGRTTGAVSIVNNMIPLP